MPTHVPLTLSLALAAAWPAPTLAAAAAAADAVAAATPLPAVVITASRQPRRVDELVADVTVIEREDIERADGRTLVELLARQPGIQITANGGLGKTSAVFLRGHDPRHVLLLVDGVRTGSATVGEPNFDNLPLDDVERIEIVRGPLASLYGSDAVAGVIQIFTRTPAEGRSMRAQVGVGSRGYRRAGAGLSVGTDAFGLTGHVQHTGNDGFSATNAAAPFGNFAPDADGFSQNAGSLRAVLKLPADWQADARLMQSNARSDFDDGRQRIDETTFTPLPGPGADSRAKLRMRVAALQVRGPVTDGWRTTLRVARSGDDYITVDSNYASSIGTIATTQDQLAWENRIATPAGSLLLVAEHLRQHVGKNDDDFTRTTRTVNSAAIGLDGGRDALTWQGSLRSDRNSQYGSKTTGAVGAGYALADGLRASVQLGTSFVAPSFNQLYWPGFGNPRLQPETGKHAELALRYARDAHVWRVAWVDNRIRGYITPGTNPGNVDARIDGLVLDWGATVARTRLAASAEFLDPRNDGGAGQLNDGKQLLRRSKRAVRVSADTDIGPYTLGASASAYSRRYDDSANTVPLAGYALLDLRADWRFAPGWTLALRVNNAADIAYETAAGYNQPRREFFVTLRYAD